MDEYIEHFIDIDDMMELKMKIPKRLSALQLKALMFKADKIFKLSEIAIVQSQPKRIIPSADGRRNNGSYKKIWTNGMIQEMVTMRENGVKVNKIAKHLNQKHNTTFFDVKKIHQKIYYLRHRKTYDNFKEKAVQEEPVVNVSQEPEQEKEKRIRIFTEDMKESIKVRIYLGDDGVKITEFLNKKYGLTLTAKQVIDKITHMKIAGEIQK